MNRSTPDCTVLVVDPCQDTQTEILSHMQERGFSVITVSDPAAALATIELTTPDIVLTDSFLPEGGGLTLTKTLRNRLSRLRSACVILCDLADAQPAKVLARCPTARRFLNHAIS